ncbi:alpha/beta fold hydrolase [Massilia sp. PWRC2]|uniref:alpha/beta fold hydrolase n=1 Tax=Massilia sp. PWRC2 TaxID=2804626 RepID=UPI003CF58E5B
MNCDQRAIRFSCLGSSLVGIIDLPERPLPRALLMVATQRHSRLGPQRQFAMLARALARRGFAVMRFDRRGVGDSEGCDYNDSDVRAAVHELCEQVPTVHEVLLLAAGSSAAIATASSCARLDARVCALLLLDPRRRAGRRSKQALSADSPAPAPAPIGAALYWRRAALPRRGASAAARLAALAAQLCAFPGRVLIIGAADDAAAPTEWRQLRSQVERLGASARVQFVEQPCSGAADTDADTAASCASWIASW